jgi:hypothetical protein
MGEVDAGWGLGRAADADEDDVGLLQFVGALGVVVGDGVVERSMRLK